jgi:hypothetical protein
MKRKELYIKYILNYKKELYEENIFLFHKNNIINIKKELIINKKFEQLDLAY